jgi:hypothetical protein
MRQLAVVLIIAAVATSVCVRLSSAVGRPRDHRQELNANPTASKSDRNRKVPGLHL